MIKYVYLIIYGLIMVFSCHLIASEDIHDGRSEEQAYLWEIKDRIKQIFKYEKHDQNIYVISYLGSIFLEKKTILKDIGTITQYRYIKRPLDDLRVKTEYDITTNEYILWDNKFMYCIDVIHLPSHLFSQRALIMSEKGLFQKPPLSHFPSPASPLKPLPATFDYPLQRLRPFFFLSWKDEKIGDVSFGNRLWGNPDYHLYGVVFVRGNTLVRIFCINDECIVREKTDDENVMKQHLDPDPREIAWRIDQYLKGDPLEKVNNEEKQKLKTLKITLPTDIEFEQGKEYPLDFPRKLFDETVPAEIRLVVSRGEIQQVIDKNMIETPNAFPNPASLPPDIDGQYTVLFGQPEKQTVYCYHIDEDGKCLAWGETEVFVKKSENPTTTYGMEKLIFE